MKERFSKESLSQRFALIVKTGVAENYSRTGYVTRGDPLALAVLHNTEIDKISGLRISSLDVIDRGYTHILLAPFSSPLLQTVVSSSYKRSDVALCMACYSRHNNQQYRHGSFVSVAVMAAADAASFSAAVLEKPWLAYRLMCYVNGGPITRADGSPAELLPGTHVTILANANIGGNIVKPHTSIPFAPDFKPNHPPR